MIVTLPLGCLKARDISFQPALPEWKTDAIEKLGYGNLNKVLAFLQSRQSAQLYFSRLQSGCSDLVETMSMSVSAL